MSDERKDITSPEAKDIHDAARAADPDHDMGGCWCCCLDCVFDAEAIWSNDAAAGIESVT